MTDCGYSFKKEAKVYIVYGGFRYSIDISAISFGQTFMEYSYSNKTIQNQNMFEQSVINKANPANFELTFPAIRESDFKILFDLALNYDTFDLYVVTASDAFLIFGCVISNANFITENLRPLSMSISGEAIRVTKLAIFPPTLPGSLVARSGSMTYNRVSYISILLDSVEISSLLVSMSIELQNEVVWTPYTSVNSAITATDADNSMYPSGYTINKRILAGTIIRYLNTADNGDLLTWNADIPIHISIGQKVGATLYGFDLNMANCSFTNRLGSDNIFMQSYDWRMTQNPTSLSSVVTYSTSA